MSSERILWDLVERHLREAEFQCARVLRAHDAFDQTLDSLATGAEQRMFINIDGLVVGGEPVRTQLLQPLLSDTNAREPRLLAACLTLLMQGQREPVIAALRSTQPRAHAAAEMALALHGGSETDAWIAATLETAREPMFVAALLRLAARRGIAVPRLEPLLDSATPAVLAAAAQVALHAPRCSHTFRLEILTRHPDASVRALALLSALADGSAPARATCRAWAEDQAEAHSQAMLWYALTDGPRAASALLAHLERATHRAPALFALGYTGQLEAIPQLLEAMASGRSHERRLAVEAFSLLTGLSLRDPEFSLPNPPRAASPAFDADDLDADLVPTPVDSLPLPNPEAVSAWWVKEQTRMPKHERVLAGRVWRLDTALEFLQSAPLRQRHAVGTWLALHARLHVDTRAFTRVQRRQLAACRPGSTS